MADRIYPDSGQPRLNGASYNPKQIPPPATYTAPRRRRRNPICVCLGWIFAALITIVVILGIAALVIYLVLHPKAPKYQLLDAHVSQLDVSGNPTFSNPQMSYNIAFTLQAYNPNKKIGIYYDDIRVFLSYDSLEVGQASIAPFYQGHKNTTILETDLTRQNITLQQTTATSLQADLGRQSIPFQILVKVRARVKVGSWKSPHFKVRDTCSVTISPPSAAVAARLLSSSCKAKWKL
ncbi:hypothetical protein O6H91_21G058500 [Diphasiastrum complanatum]|uniref:Uncharacterized protein n=1 Tax=Diphasiastrum complanatum TaxID=34168 RepID=A0ACC2AL50_DIPCM|nr:hypothetical protein O6H91_21G058500 [Diphasiastrum complanatum]